MPVNLLALCGKPGDTTVKRVRTSAAVQRELEGFFDTLEIQFREGVDRESHFDGRWTPDSDELSTIPITPEADSIVAQTRPGVLALDEIDISGFDSEHIRALAVIVVSGVTSRLLLQAFGNNQRLYRKFALISHANVFDKIDVASFTMSTNIDVIVEAGLIKFKSFNMARRVFDLSDFYKTASDLEVRAFCQSSVLDVDAGELIAVATQPIRKLISSVQNSNVLTANTADDIRRKASGLVDITLSGSKLRFQKSRKEVKDLLTFLDHGIYKSPIDDDPYEANSRRRRTP